MSAITVIEVYLGMDIKSLINPNLVELLLSPGAVIKMHYPSQKDDVDTIIQPLRNVWNNRALPAINGMKDLNLDLHEAIHMQKAWTGTKLTSAELVRAIKSRQECMSNVVKQLTKEKEKATAVAQEEALAKGKALAKSLGRKETEVFVSVSSNSKTTLWTQALRIVEEAEQFWEATLINVQVLSQAIHKTCRAIDNWVKDTDHISYDSWQDMKIEDGQNPHIDKDIETITAAFTAAEEKISKAIAATKKAIDFSSQLDGSL
jgi:hypothetical protein